MEEGDGDIKHLFGEEDIDLRCVETNFVPLPHIIGQREIGHRLHHATTQHLERWGEESFVQRKHSHVPCQIPTTSKTTYLLAFSPDGTKVASSHGDHNIYVTDMKTGKSICTLKGHPRSPWCVAFHPSSNEIIASGCLGGEVRVWDLKGGSEVWTPNKKCENVIASLAFHPTDQVLVIATENDLYFWDWFCPRPFAKISTASKLEKVKFVEFDPLGYKLITGIAVVRPERNQLDSALHTTVNNNNNSNSTNNNTDNSTSTHTDQPLRRYSPPIRSPPREAYRRYVEGHMQRARRHMHNQADSNNSELSSNQDDPPSSLSSSRRATINQVRNFYQAVSDRVDRNGNQDLGTLLGPGPSSLSDLSLPEGSTSSPVLRRRYMVARPSGSGSTSAQDDESRIGGGDFRPTLRPPASDDSASSSSSSVDSSSSSTSATSGGGATHHERNTRLSLLWTSRLHRGGAVGVRGESPSPPGAVYYDLEERRGEGSVMRGSGGAGASRAGDDSRDLNPSLPGDSDHRELRPLRPFNYCGRTSRLLGGRVPLPELDVNEDDSDNNDLSQHRPRGWRHTGSQGGRWMYYRGKFPGNVAPSRNSGGGPMRGSTGSPGPGPSGASSLSRSTGPLNRSSSVSRTSPPGVRRSQHQAEDDSLLAIPGPSGLSRRNTGGASSSPADLFPPLPPGSASSSSGPWSSNQSLLDPHFGFQLLSRQIENMQNIVHLLSNPRAQLELTRHRTEITQLHQIRSMLYDIQHQISSLSIPRAQLELTRPRTEITQLQQIRSMLYDIQHQIRSLRTSIDQTISEEFPPGSDESLNSTSLNPEPLASELLNSGGRSLTDEVELEVNIGTDDMDHYSYSTLAEEDPEQLASAEGLISSNPLDLNPLNPLPPSDNVPSTMEPIPENESSSRPSSSSSFRLTNKNSRNASRALRTLAASRVRNRRNWRNRLVWTGLLRRLPAQRRGSSRSRTNSLPSSSTEATRNLRRREVREARGEKRRNALYNRRVERRTQASIDNGAPSASAVGCSSNSSQGQEEASSQVRRRHLGDWQRRLRSILALQQERQREQDRPGGLPSSSSGNTEMNGEINRPPSSETTTRSEAVSTVSTTVALTTASTTTSSSSATLMPQSITNNGIPNGEEAEDDDDLADQPERVTRAGPPTTSLSSRIATMLAEQREARIRGSPQPTDDVDGTSNSARSGGGGARPRLRAGGINRLRYELQRRLGRSYLRGIPFPLPPPQYSLPSASSLDDLPASLSDEYSGVRPVCPTLRSLRREIMISHRNRMLRRSSNTLVSGGDLAGATLAAINPTSIEEDRQRESFQQERRESYRHMLQVMADRLHQMMNQSLSGSLNHPNQRDCGAGGAPFNPLNEEDGEAMSQPLNLRPSRRRSSLLRGPPSIRSHGGNNSFNASDEYHPPPSAAAATSALDRHMHNLRLLVRLALHLIYQLLNFICNQNLSYEERPISRLHNPFRDSGDSGAQRPAASGGSVPAARTPSENAGAASAASSFEMEIEPGLHNLRALLETVRLASEELRQDVEQPTPPPRPGAASLPTRVRRNAVVYANQPSPVISLGGETTTTTTSTRAESGGTVSSSYSGSTVRRRLTDFLIRTSGGGLTSSSRGRDGESDREEIVSSNPRIQRPLPTTPTLQRADGDHTRSTHHLPIPQIVLSDMSQDGSDPRGTVPNESSLASSPPGDMELRTFGGIPLRFLGRQNAVDRRTPPDSEGEDSSGGSENNNNNNGREAEGEGGARSFSWYPGGSSTGYQQHPFRHWNNLHPLYNGGSSQTPPLPIFNPQEREPEQLMYFSQPYFNQYIVAPRNIAGSLFDPYSPVLYNGTNRFYRIQAWDFRNFEIPDISDSYSNIVVPKCRIHFDASVSISVDGTLLAAVLPDSQSLTRIGVYSLETRTLGQLLFSSNIGFNIVCVSFSPTMRHLVVGISSHRLGVHHTEKHVIGRIYKLCHSPSSYRGGYPGNLRFCQAIELQSELRQSSLNCIRWVPIPGQGLVYGTNRGQLTIIR